ncbi:hypothetical protein [Haloarcula marina]|uniref:hypothetical protein n=1 Tax=Haloarcula marina TaxID=2961574 RepID=UPI0020B8053B|nr:hypothetical protein [Halomicroarcula marina]
MGGRRAQADTVGTVFFVGVVVATVAVGGGALLTDGSIGDELSGAVQTPLADLSVSVTPVDLSVTHEGGDAIPLDPLAVVARSGGTTERYPIASANVTDVNGDGAFGPSDDYERGHGLTGATATVMGPTTRRSPRVRFSVTVHRR